MEPEASEQRRAVRTKVGEEPGEENPHAEKDRVQCQRDGGKCDEHDRYADKKTRERPAPVGFRQAAASLALSQRSIIAGWEVRTRNALSATVHGS